MPGLFRGVARTAAIAGTATAVSNRVSRRQAGRWASQEEQQAAEQQQYAAPPAAVRTAAPRGTAGGHGRQAGSAQGPGGAPGRGRADRCRVRAAEEQDPELLTANGVTTPRNETGVGVGLLVATAVVPGTFARSLSDRSPVDQGIITGLSAGLHYLLTVGTQDARAGRSRGGGRRRGRSPRWRCWPQVAAPAHADGRPDGDPAGSGHPEGTPRQARRGDAPRHGCGRSAGGSR